MEMKELKLTAKTKTGEQGLFGKDGKPLLDKDGEQKTEAVYATANAVTSVPALPDIPTDEEIIGFVRFFGIVNDNDCGMSLKDFRDSLVLAKYEIELCNIGRKYAKNSELTQEQKDKSFADDIVDAPACAIVPAIREGRVSKPKITVDAAKALIIETIRSLGFDPEMLTEAQKNALKLAGIEL